MGQKGHLNAHKHTHNLRIELELTARMTAEFLIPGFVLWGVERCPDSRQSLHAGLGSDRLKHFDVGGVLDGGGLQQVEVEDDVAQVRFVGRIPYTSCLCNVPNESDHFPAQFGPLCSSVLQYEAPIGGDIGGRDVPALSVPATQHKDANRTMCNEAFIGCSVGARRKAYVHWLKRAAQSVAPRRVRS